MGLLPHPDARGDFFLPTLLISFYTPPENPKRPSRGASAVNGDRPPQDFPSIYRNGSKVFSGVFLCVLSPVFAADAHQKDFN
jgi:hypothetical protein